MQTPNTLLVLLVVACLEGIAVGEPATDPRGVTSFGQPRRETARLPQQSEEIIPLPPPSVVVPAKAEQHRANSLDSLEALALVNNPAIRRARQQAAAAWARTGYVDKLPDPVLSTMFFAPPMPLIPDRMIGEIQVMQMIPWLDRLRAEGRQAHLEALAAENDFQGEKLRVLADLRATWARIFVIHKQIETTLADTAQIESLVRTANARVRTGGAPAGDVLLATLELSSLHEQLITLRRQLVSASAELNVLVGRPATTAVSPVHELHAELPDWDTDILLHVAMNVQPDLAAARLRTAAARYGIDIARLKQRPDFTFSGGWVPMDAPGSTMPGAGADVATIGVSTNLPVRRVKYEAMHAEAARQHAAARSSEDEIRLRLEAVIVDVWAQATAAKQIVDLYDRTILPQARQTYAADLQALENGTVDFDRVVRDYLAVLTMELGRHRAAGDLAIALARVQQAVGADAAAIPRVLSTAR